MKASPALVIVFAVSALLQLDAANVVTDWNAIASTTIVKNGGKPSATSGVWFGTSQPIFFQR